MLPRLNDIGLEINPSKSEIININSTTFHRDIEAIEQLLPGVRVTAPKDLVILGSPIDAAAIKEHINAQTNTFLLMIDRLSQIDPHPALYLLRNCFSLPRLLYLLRSSPSYNLQDQLTVFDNVMKEGSERICNVAFDNTGWKQATLPISLGGIGLTAASDIAFSAYASSMHASQSLTTGILSHFPESSVDQSLSQMIQAWSGLGFLVVPEESRHLQKSWSDIYFKAKAEGLKDGLNQHRLACLSTASQPHSGDWLKAIPVASLGTALDGESVRVGIAVRLGLRICERHTCRCGVLIDEFGLHPLSCRLSAGRIPRHSALNDVIKRTLDSAGLHSILEPIGLDRGDGRDQMG